MTPHCASAVRVSRSVLENIGSRLVARPGARAGFRVRAMAGVQSAPGEAERVVLWGGHCFKDSERLEGKQVGSACAVTRALKMAGRPTTAFRSRCSFRS